MQNPDRPSAVLLTLLILALPTGALAAAPQPTKPAPDADSIKVKFTFEYSEEHTKPAGDSSIRFESQRSGTVTATLDRFRGSVGLDSFKLKRPAEGNISVQDSIVTRAGGQENVQKEHGSGLPSREDTKITVEIDPKRGVYSFLISLKTDTVTEVIGPESKRTDKNTAGFSWTSPQYPLPAKRGFIKGQETLTPGVGEGSLGSNFVPLGRAMKSMDGKTLASVGVEWEIGTPPP